MTLAPKAITFAVITATAVGIVIVVPSCTLHPASAPTPARTPAPVANPPVSTAKLFLFSEDFESTPTGEIPQGFTKVGSVSVVDDMAHSGKKSLRIDAAPRGARRITTADPALLKELGGSHWGRLYFKIQTPFPIQASGVVHSTFVAGTAQSPQFHDSIEVRVLDTVMNTMGNHQYIYNVQPKSPQRREFGKGGAYSHRYTDQWQLAEWFIDFPTQSYRLFIDGKEIKDVAIHNGANNFTRTEIPELFESLSFGIYNYQALDKGFVVWMDDIALSKDRIGNRGLPEDPQKPTDPTPKP